MRRGTEPNVTAGLLDALGKEYGATPSAEDLAAYVYALLGGGNAVYAAGFWKASWRTPGAPRVPLTKGQRLVRRSPPALGSRLIWLQ